MAAMEHHGFSYLATLPFCVEWRAEGSGSDMALGIFGFAPGVRGDPAFPIFDFASSHVTVIFLFRRYPMFNGAQTTFGNATPCLRT